MDVPGRDVTVTQSRPAAGLQADPSILQKQHISRVSRGELEDRFLRLYEETVHLKQHIHTQDDKIKKLGTKLIRVAKDCSSVKELTSERAQPESSTRDMKMKIVERLQKIVWTMQMDDEARKLEVVGRAPTSLLPHSGQRLHEEARAEIHNRENVMEVRQSRTDEQEQSYKLLQDELRRKEAEHEQQLLQLRQEQTSNLSNVTMKLEEQLAERSNAVAELRARFLQLHEGQQSLSVCCKAAVLKVEELSAQLKDEMMKSLDLKTWLQSVIAANSQTEQLQEQLRELALERDLLKESNEKLLNRAFSGVQWQQLQVKEQQLQLHIAQCEMAMQADPVNNNEILNKVKPERGVFELTDPAGLPVGHVEVTLSWRFVPPSGSVTATEQLEGEEIEAEQQQEEEEEMKAGDCLHLRSSLQAPKPKHGHKTEETRAAVTKKVRFVLPAEPESTPQPEEDEEETHLPEGQPPAVSSRSISDDSKVSEEISQDVEEATGDQSGSMRSDSDGCTVRGQTAARKPSEQMRVAILSLSLKPESRVARDSSMVHLFVEYSLLDLASVETTWSQPKPAQGESVSFNYSKVIPVDAENNGARRRLLRDILLGRNPDMEKIRFTVVSELLEEDEQARRFKEVGVASVRIPEILEKQQELTETSLDVRATGDSSEVVGCLAVSVEGLEALQAIMEDGELLTSVAAQLPSA